MEWWKEWRQVSPEENAVWELIPDTLWGVWLLPFSICLSLHLKDSTLQRQGWKTTRAGHELIIWVCLCKNYSPWTVHYQWQVWDTSQKGMKLTESTTKAGGDLEWQIWSNLSWERKPRWVYPTPCPLSSWKAPLVGSTPHLWGGWSHEWLFSV